MSVRTVTLEDGRTLNIDLTDEEWDSAAPPTPQGQAQGERSDAVWAEMRRKSQAGEQAVRELAFIKAGLDPAKDPRIGDFIKVYDGDLDVAKIKDAAIARGYLEAPPDPNAPQQRTPEQQAALAADQRISQAGEGAIPHELSGEEQLAEALATGGAPAMIAKAKELGVPIANQADTPHHSDPVGWGA